MVKWIALSVLALAPAIAAAGPNKVVDCDAIIQPLGHRWYSGACPDAMHVPSDRSIMVRICLEDVPGDLDSTPTIRVQPISRDSGGPISKAGLAHVSVVGFSPLHAITVGGVEEMPYITVSLRAEPGSEGLYQLYAVVRGGQ